MQKPRKDHLETAGWRVDDAADFLDLSPEEAAFVELKLALAHHLQEMRAQHGWTQTQVARRLGSSQSRAHVLLLAVYHKSAKENLDTAEERLIAGLMRNYELYLKEASTNEK